MCLVLFWIPRHPGYGCPKRPARRHGEAAGHQEFSGTFLLVTVAAGAGVINQYAGGGQGGAGGNYPIAPSDATGHFAIM